MKEMMKRTSSPTIGTASSSTAPAGVQQCSYGTLGDVEGMSADIRQEQAMAMPTSESVVADTNSTGNSNSVTALAASIDTRNKELINSFRRRISDDEQVTSTKFRRKPPKWACSKLNLKLIEACSQEVQEACINLHTSKPVFSMEAETGWVQERIVNGDAYDCKTFALVDENKETDVRASVIARFNYCPALEGDDAASLSSKEEGNQYERGELHWAQIMNISAKTEGQGDGSYLFRLLEDFFKAQELNLVVLFPAANVKAPKFWRKLGFKERSDAPLLPDRERPKVIAEFDVTTGIVLPMWEKDLSLRIIPRRRMRRKR